MIRFDPGSILWYFNIRTSTILSRFPGRSSRYPELPWEILQHNLCYNLTRYSRSRLIFASLHCFACPYFRIMRKTGWNRGSYYQHAPANQHISHNRNLSRSKPGGELVLAYLWCGYALPCQSMQGPRAHWASRDWSPPLFQRLVKKNHRYGNSNSFGWSKWKIGERKTRLQKIIHITLKKTLD